MNPNYYVPPLCAIEPHSPGSDEENNIDDDKSPKTSPRGQSRIEFESLAQFFHLPINEAAKGLGVCATVLKKVCRKYGIPRWPHRKIKKLDTMISMLEMSVAKNGGTNSSEIRKKIDMAYHEKMILLAAGKLDAACDNDKRRRKRASANSEGGQQAKKKKTAVSNQNAEPFSAASSPEHSSNYASPMFSDIDFSPIELGSIEFASPLDFSQPENFSVDPCFVSEHGHHSQTHPHPGPHMAGQGFPTAPMVGEVVDVGFVPSEPMIPGHAFNFVQPAFVYPCGFLSSPHSSVPTRHMPMYPLVEHANPPNTLRDPADLVWDDRLSALCADAPSVGTFLAHHHHQDQRAPVYIQRHNFSRPYCVDSPILQGAI